MFSFSKFYLQYFCYPTNSISDTKLISQYPFKYFLGSAFTIQLSAKKSIDFCHCVPKNILLSVCDDGWDGADNIATLNAINQKLEGTILVGSNSTLNINFKKGSNFNGSISGTITNAKGSSVSTEVGTVNVTIDQDSIWTLTSDTYITSFDGDISSINSNGYTLYVNGVAII